MDNYLDNLAERMMGRVRTLLKQAHEFERGGQLERAEACGQRAANTLEAQVFIRNKVIYMEGYRR